MSEDHSKDLNLLQIQLIKSGLVKEEEVLELIATKKAQAKKTRAEIKKIVATEKVNRQQAIKILRRRRQKKRKRKK